ncbi:MAG: hypothetical protein ACP5OB_08370, partial [Candidatus Ratteibacteria bacterium]
MEVKKEDIWENYIKGEIEFETEDIKQELINVFARNILWPSFYAEKDKKQNHSIGKRPVIPKRYFNEDHKEDEDDEKSKQERLEEYISNINQEYRRLLRNYNVNPEVKEKLEETYEKIAVIMNCGTPKIKKIIEDLGRKLFEAQENVMESEQVLKKIITKADELYPLCLKNIPHLLKDYSIELPNRKDKTLYSVSRDDLITMTRYAIAFFEYRLKWQFKAFNLNPQLNFREKLNTLDLDEKVKTFQKFLKKKGIEKVENGKFVYRGILPATKLGYLTYAFIRYCDFKWCKKQWKKQIKELGIEKDDSNINRWMKKKVEKGIIPNMLFFEIVHPFTYNFPKKVPLKWNANSLFSFLVCYDPFLAKPIHFKNPISLPKLLDTLNYPLTETKMLTPKEKEQFLFKLLFFFNRENFFALKYLYGNEAIKLYNWIIDEGLKIFPDPYYFKQLFLIKFHQYYQTTPIKRLSNEDINQFW